MGLGKERRGKSREAGTIGAMPCVMNAAIDALSPIGIDHLDMPLTPDRVWRALNEK